MSPTRVVLPVMLVVLAGLTGCGSARLIRSSNDGSGVVAIPSNTNTWPSYYYDSAAKLMASKCPNGYEIVKEEEVAVGKTTTTNESVDRQSHSDNQDRTTSSVVTSTSDRTEYRIHYRPRMAQASMPPVRQVSSPPIINTSAEVPVPGSAQPSGSLPAKPIPVKP